MMGCVLQDACDNMPGILIFKLKLEAARNSDSTSKSVGLRRKYAGLEVERRWL